MARKNFGINFGSDEPVRSIFELTTQLYGRIVSIENSLIDSDNRFVVRIRAITEPKLDTMFVATPMTANQMVNLRRIAKRVDKGKMVRGLFYVTHLRVLHNEIHCRLAEIQWIKIDGKDYPLSQTGAK